MAKVKLIRSLPNSVGSGCAMCMVCADDGNMSLTDEQGDTQRFMRDVRRHVRETGHAVCVTMSYEFFIEVKPSV